MVWMEIEWKERKIRMDWITINTMGWRWRWIHCDQDGHEEEERYGHTDTERMDGHTDKERMEEEDGHRIDREEDRHTMDCTLTN